jgi:hypothetical protein
MAHIDTVLVFEIIAIGQLSKDLLRFSSNFNLGFTGCLGSPEKHPLFAWTQYIALCY